jgi:hypothetical protein
MKNRADATSQSKSTESKPQWKYTVLEEIHLAWTAMMRTKYMHPLGLRANILLALKACLWAVCSTIAQRLAPPHQPRQPQAPESGIAYHARRLGLALTTAKELARRGYNLQTARREPQKLGPNGHALLQGSAITWDALTMPNDSSSATATTNAAAASKNPKI